MESIKYTPLYTYDHMVLSIWIIITQNSLILTHRGLTWSGCWHHKNLLTEKYCESWWTLGQHETKHSWKFSRLEPKKIQTYPEIRKIIWTIHLYDFGFNIFNFAGSAFEVWKVGGKSPRRLPMTCEPWLEILRKIRNIIWVCVWFEVVLTW